MVDYNIAIPQQQLYQAPDPMQNFLRMQQMEQMGATSRLRNMQAQNLLAAQQQTAAERTQAAAIDEEASNAVIEAGSPTAAAQNLTQKGRLGAAARISALGETLSKGQQAELDTVDNTLKGFGYWSTHVRSPEEAGSLGAGMYNTSRLRPFFESIGIKSAEQAAQKFSTDFATDENAWRTGLAKLDAPTLFSLRAAKQVDLPGGGKGTIDPNRPGVINESVIREAGAPELTPGGGAGAGRVNTYPVSPTRVANMNAAAGRTGGAPIVDDGGLAARADMGVNALVAGQRRPTTVVGNALAAPAAAASPYGELVQPPAARAPGVVGSREFAQRAKDAELAQAVKKAGLETEARKLAELSVATPEAERVKNVAKKEVTETLKTIVGEYKNLASRGALIQEDGAQSFSQRAGIGLKAALPSQITTVWDPKTGGNISTIENLRRDLIPTITALTGAKSIDAVAEMNSVINSLTTPGQTDATIVKTLNNFGAKYGLGKLLSIEDLAPAKSAETSGIPAGRRSVAPAKPTERPPLTIFERP